MKKTKLILLSGLILFSSMISFSQEKSVYPGFPEDFESPAQETKASYATANVELKTGNWRFSQVILANLKGRDRFNPAGKQGVRFAQNKSIPGYLQMNFDLSNGASKVTFLYGSFRDDASSTFRLEYSVNGGKSWKKTGEDISDASLDAKTASFDLDIKGKVRFRIHKLGLGSMEKDLSIKNGRLCVDDFMVYEN